MKLFKKLIGAFACVILFTGCQEKVEDNPENSYEYICGEYETSYGTLVITPTENYLLTDTDEKLDTDVSYDYDGCAEVRLVSSRKTEIAAVSSYYADKTTEIHFELQKNHGTLIEKLETIYGNTLYTDKNKTASKFTWYVSKKVYGCYESNNFVTYTDEGDEKFYSEIIKTNHFD